MPFNADHLRELTFSNPAEETVYTTCYKFIDNLMEESIPYKYLLTKEQRFGQFEIVGQNGSEGSFYVMQNGYFDSKFCIELMGKVYLGYSLDKGRNNYVSIYDGDRQIAQITKPIAVIDNLDIYSLHERGYRNKLLDSRDSAPFDTEWCRVDEEIKALKNTQSYTDENEEEQSGIRKKTFMIMEKNTGSELSDYVSDDFGLIYDSLVLNYKDEWLNKLIAAYKNKKNSCRRTLMQFQLAKLGN